ncbi:hydantoinase/oxoprolinase N-terminal domain-containing protein [Pararhodobacter oceanensis]|uniref:hydantoinase/oxoprolinase N-terminal domain-containing protein n=1 Tax=Pararhodobacter oceanensis TaxID=2172121 RepID=UPI003A953525
MSIFLGVDTGGTYTDAILLDDAAQRLLSSAKALTSRPDLSKGIGEAIDAVLAQPRAEGQTPVAAEEITMVALSTTLATNALVEGQGGRAALVMIGFDRSPRGRAELLEALGDDPLIEVGGGHQHSGVEAQPLDIAALNAALDALPKGISAVAVTSQFATRNPAHEVEARALIRARTGLPVTCSHELSAGLNGPKRALTALLNARLVAMIDRLIRACETHLARREITAPLMVVRGDGALVSAALVRERPIETILSGPAASIAGASWLTGEKTALVSDIGGTTTDICLLRDGKPAIDPQGARVGRFRTMVEAVAMRTSGLGGDSEVRMSEALTGGVILGPRRMLPMALAAVQYPALVHGALDRALDMPAAADESWSFALPLFTDLPDDLGGRELAVAERLQAGPLRLSETLFSRIEAPALIRLVQRGLVLLCGPTPSDAAHVLDLQDGWDRAAAEKALTLLARRRAGDGNRLAADAQAMAQMIIDQMTQQTVTCLLESAFAEDPRDWADAPEDLARHPLLTAALQRGGGLVRLDARLDLPVIGLGASAHCYYGPVGARLDCPMLVPEHAGVANAVGAVVGQVSMRVEGLITCAGFDAFIAHLEEGPAQFSDPDAAVAALSADLERRATERAIRAGVESARVSITRNDAAAEIEGRRMTVEIGLSATASGRPRIASSADPAPAPMPDRLPEARRELAPKSPRQQPQKI